MHIGYFSPGWPLEGQSNGIVTYVHEMVRGMRARGHTVTIFSPSSSDDVVTTRASSDPRALSRRVGGMADHWLGTANVYASDVIEAVRSFHHKQPIDVFEIEESFGIAEKLRLALPFPVVTRLHGPHFLGEVEKVSGHKALRHRMRIGQEGTAIRNARAVTAMSRLLLEETFRYYGVRGVASRVILNPQTTCRDEDRWTLAGSDPDLILFVGRFDARKGADVALRAFSILAEKFPDLRLILAGGDPGIRMPDGSVVQLAQFLATEVPEVARRRISHVGVQTPAQLIQLRKRARVSVMPSRFETAGYALFEAMAMGAPIVSSAHYGALDHLETGKNGIVVPIEDVPATADALETLLVNPDLAARIGQEAWKLVEDKFSPDKICRETEELYQSLLPGRAS